MSDKTERIILDVAYQPQVRTKTDTMRLMLDVIIALIPAAIVGVLQFGVYTLVLLLTSICSSVFWEWGYRRLFKKEASIGDLSAVVTGLLLGLTMPPTAPWWRLLPTTKRQRNSRRRPTSQLQRNRPEGKS